MQRNSFPSVQRGLTLVECCITLAIASILVGTAMPSFEKTKQRRGLEGAAAEMVTDLHYVRSEAVARNEGVRISFRGVTGGTCTIIHTGSASDCRCGNDGIPQCDSGAVLVKSLFHRAANGVAVSANVGSMRFDPINGSVTPAGTVTMVNSQGQTIRHVVNILGRVRSCSPGGTVKDVRMC